MKEIKEERSIKFIQINNDVILFCCLFLKPIVFDNVQSNMREHHSRNMNEC